MAKKALTRSLCFVLPLNLNCQLLKDTSTRYWNVAALALDARVGPGASKETVAQLLQANVPGLVVNPGAYASTTAMAMYAQESALNKAMVDVVGLATAGMPYQFLG